MANEPSSQTSYFWPIVILGLVLLASVALPRLESRLRGNGGGPPHQPVPMPPVWVQGWLNEEDWLNEGGSRIIDRETLAGKVVVLDAWAIWCGPCRDKMPAMAKLAASYQGASDVVFIGITPDETDDEELAALRRYVDSVEGFNWPVGYGASPMFDALDIRQIPTLILFGRDGRSIWRGMDVATLGEKIDAELQHQPGDS